jgi:hypothetical protein
MNNYVEIVGNSGCRSSAKELDSESGMLSCPDIRLIKNEKK